ncbi:MAG TPA: exosortase/archaeosortase family protein [Candidatus Bathyarchaeia archaeon]|nr:exosortase/archaeosortase family protein [Candidatus Bathyarchaeia archaeon]
MRLTISGDTYKKLLIPLSFMIMMLIAYVFDPSVVGPSSFEETWTGRAFYLFFLWLFALEFILGGTRSTKSGINQSARLARTAGGFLILMIPTIYIIAFYMFGLNNAITALGLGLGNFFGVPQGMTWSSQAGFISTYFPISFEYIIMTASILTGVFVLLHYEGIKQFSISISLLTLVGVFYVINTFRPYASASFPNFLSLLSPILPQSGVSIQGFVPFISSIVAFVMQRLGYAVQMAVLQDGTVQMLVNGYGFAIYWPCAGVYSLFIYTFVILLFLKDFPVSLRGKVVGFVIGAVGTFFVNILRIVSIMEIYISQGAAAGDIFHDYYGELFFLFWIVFYLFALVLVQRFMIRKTPIA